MICVHLRRQSRQGCFNNSMLHKPLEICMEACDKQALVQAVVLCTQGVFRKKWSLMRSIGKLMK